MNTMRIPLRLAALVAMLAVAVSAASAQADILFSDEFDRDDPEVGENWDDQDSVGGIGVEATTSGDADGRAIFDGSEKVLRSKIIPTKGYQSLTYSQTASFLGAVETNDELFIDYQTPGGALTNITTVFHPNGNVANQALDAGAEDTYIRIAYKSGDLFGDERIALDNMSLEGTATGGTTAQDIYFNQFTDDSDLANWSFTKSGNATLTQNVTTFQMTGGSGTNIALSRTIDTTNFEDLALLVTGETVSLESNETFFLEYSTDNGGNWTELDSTSGTNRLDVFVALPAAAENNPNFMIRGRANGLSTGNDTVRIDMVHLVGTIIPEPGTLALLGLGGLAAVVRRRRA